MTLSSFKPRKMLGDFANDAAIDRIGYSSIIKSANSGPNSQPCNSELITSISQIFSLLFILWLTNFIFAPIFCNAKIIPFLVGLLLIFLTIIFEFLLISADTMKKALLERSFGTSIFFGNNSFCPKIFIIFLLSTFFVSIFAPNDSNIISV